MVQRLMRRLPNVGLFALAPLILGLAPWWGLIVDAEPPPSRESVATRLEAATQGLVGEYAAKLELCRAVGSMESCKLD